jgi:sigma-54 dependent transcriptional regulator, acetoin dehydrogenase operon transcriptional activator AcoR
VNLSDEGWIDDVSGLLRPSRGTTGCSDGSPSNDVGIEASAGESPAVQSLKDVERDAIRRALAACQFNVTRCAAILEISKPALYAKVKRFKIKLERPLH